MLQHILNLIYSLRDQNCSIGMMLNANDTPILSSTFKTVRKNDLQFLPIMLPDAMTEDVFIITQLTLMVSHFILAKYSSVVNQRSDPVIECFVLMMENVDLIAEKHDIALRAANKKYILIVGEFDFQRYDDSNVPILHLNNFGHIQIYCQTFNNRFWPGKKYYLEEFLWNFTPDELCPIKSYIRW